MMDVFELLMVNESLLAKIVLKISLVLLYLYTGLSKFIVHHDRWTDVRSQLVVSIYVVLR
jgi:hypothetical protein